MSLSDSRLAYTDCYELFDKAVEANLGIRVRLASHSDAVHLRMRMHQARQIVRKQSKLVYEEGDPFYGVSEYDQLVIRIKTLEADSHWIFIEKNTIKAMEIVSLDLALPQPETLKLLEGPQTETDFPEAEAGASETQPETQPEPDDPPISTIRRRF